MVTISLLKLGVVVFKTSCCVLREARSIPNFIFSKGRRRGCIPSRYVAPAGRFA
jgi:hypothetical protein